MCFFHFTHKTHPTSLPLAIARFTLHIHFLNGRLDAIICPLMGHLLYDHGLSRLERELLFFRTALLFDSNHLKFAL